MIFSAAIIIKLSKIEDKEDNFKSRRRENKPLIQRITLRWTVDSSAETSEVRRE